MCTIEDPHTENQVYTSSKLEDIWITIRAVDFERLISGKRWKGGFHFGHQPFGHNSTLSVEMS